MKALRLAALISFAAGLAMLIAGFVFSGDDETKAQRFEDFDLRGSPTAMTETTTPSPGATTTVPSITPTATPTPYDGKVARMKIPTLGIDYPIEEIGIKADNELETPKDELGKIGWYHIYARPGWGKNAVFAAHVYWEDTEGPFWRLREAKPGAEIQVVMDNGTVYRYSILSKQQYRRDTIDMGALIWPPTRPANEEWITLITCGGEIQWDRDGRYGEYLSRDVVVAKRIQ